MSALWGPASRMAAGAYVAFIFVWLFAPVAVIVLFSFTASPRMSLPIEGFTLTWYDRAFSSPLFARSLINSVILAATTALVATTLGVSFAFGLARLRRAVRAAAVTASLLPAAVPVLVLGIALAVLFRTLDLAPGLLNAAVGHVLVALPFVILTMNARLESFDFSTLEAARDLGATPLQTFRDVTFPLVRPSVLGASLLAMALSLDEFVVTWFNIGNLSTIPVLIWGLLRRGVDPSINALATAVLVALVVLVALSNLIGRRRA